MASNPKRLLVAGTALALLTGPVTGCAAPASVAYDTYAGSPPGYDGTGGTLNGRPGAVWLAGKQEFAIVTFGSSSCPPIPTSLQTEPPSAVTVTFVAAPTEACTEDVAATTHEFRTPEGIEEDAAVTLHVQFDFQQQYSFELTLEP